MSDDKSLKFDLDKDGVPDVVIKDTNGHTVYVNVRWLIGTLVLVAGGVLAYIGL